MVHVHVVGVRDLLGPLGVYLYGQNIAPSATPEKKGEKTKEGGILALSLPVFRREIHWTTSVADSRIWVICLFLSHIWEATY